MKTLSNREKSSLLTLACVLAIAIGTLCFVSFFETSDAFVTGAVIGLVVYCAARAVLVKGRAGEQQFSLSFLLELFAAFALAFRGLQLGWLNLLHEDPTNAFFAFGYVTVYVVKTTWTRRARHVEASGRINRCSHRIPSARACDFAEGLVIPTE